VSNEAVRCPNRRTRPRIAVAFDEGAAARAALAQAAALARSLHGELFVLHAATPFYSSFERSRGVSREVARARARGQAVLVRASESLGSGVRWRPVLLVGEPAEVIPKRAAELAADMLVVGSSGRGAVARLVGGSVSGAIVARASVPVLVVPETPVEAADGGDTAWSAMPTATLEAA
jgi:nucleotide-binding universal stress UspA family protein